MSDKQYIYVQCGPNGLPASLGSPGPYTVSDPEPAGVAISGLAARRPGYLTQGKALAPKQAPKTA